MLNKVPKYKSSFNFKKICIVLGALLLILGLGSGMNMVFAGQDAGSSLLNWFGVKRTAAEQEIAVAITEEKKRLMGELKTALEEEKQRVEEELAAFIIEEKDRRILALQEYAASLKANIATDLTEQKEAIIADLDAQYVQAIDELNKPSAPTPTPIEMVLPSEPGVDPDVETERDEIIVSKPEADEEVIQNPAPEPDADGTFKSEAKLEP